jgi:hypothetical protein
MRGDEALLSVLQEAKQLACHLPEAVWYGFGSYFNGQRSFGDIDILIVCRTTKDAIIVRAKMGDVCAYWPLHLLIMTDDEEAETTFVASQGCIMLDFARRGYDDDAVDDTRSTYEGT